MKDNRPSIKRNFILNTTYQVLIMIVPLVTAPYVSRVLGADGVGIYSYTYANMIFFFMFGAMGVRIYGVREIAYLQNDPHGRSKLFFELMILRFFTSALAIAAYLVYLLQFVTVDYKVAALQMLFLVSGLFDIVWLFQGMEDFARVVLRNTLLKIFNIVLVFIFIKTREDVDVYTILMGSMAVAANLSVWAYVPRHIQAVPWRELRPFRHLKEEFLLFLPTIAIQIYMYVDKSMLRAFSVNSIENGYYDQAEKIVRLAISVITSLSMVMAPRIAKTFADGDRRLLDGYMRKTFRATWMLAVPVMFGIIGVSATFVPVFFGPGYDKVKLLAPMYSVAILFVSASQILGMQFLVGIGRQNVYTAAVTVSALVNILTNLVLIPRFASIGATAATTLAELVGAVICMVYCLRKDLLGLADVFGDSGKIWLAGLGMLGLLLLLTARLPVGVLPLLLEIAAGAAVYFVLLLFLRDRFLMTNIKSLADAVLKRRKS